MLLAAHRVYADFDKIVLLDRAGDARAGSTILNGGGVQPFAVTRLVGDQGALHDPDADGRHYRSNVFLGNGFDGTVPEVVFSAAIVTPSGLRDGIVKGSLNLSRIGRIAGDLVDPGGTTLMVIDDRGMVIGAAGLGAPSMMAHVGGTTWVQSTLASGHWRIPRLRRRGARRRPVPDRPLRHGVRRLARLRPSLGGAGRSAGDALLRGHRRLGAVQPDHRGAVRAAGGPSRDLADRAARRGDP